MRRWTPRVVSGALCWGRCLEAGFEETRCCRGEWRLIFFVSHCIPISELASLIANANVEMFEAVPSHLV